MNMNNLNNELLIVLINSKLRCNLVCIQKLFHEYCDLPYQIELNANSCQGAFLQFFVRPSEMFEKVC